MGTFLTEDRSFEACGVHVKQKILPSNLRPGKLLNTPNHRPLWVTIHNTDDVREAAGTNDAEQYARATFNGNMRDVFVHFYVDETDCWHLLPLNEIGYHAGDYSNRNGGNWTSIAIEIIEKNGTTADDKKAEDRGARLAAWLLHEYGLGIDRLTTHQRWNGKNCPVFILPHWSAFVNQVKAYMAEIEAQEAKKKADTAAPATPAPSGKHYRVQVGYYSVKTNAEAMQKKLKAAGFDAIIKEE